jgi:hypothetical protein
MAESLGCLDVVLDDEHRERLDAVSAVELGYPHDFLAGLMARYAPRT